MPKFNAMISCAVSYAFDDIEADSPESAKNLVLERFHHGDHDEYDFLDVERVEVDDLDEDEGTVFEGDSL